jgi:hypothetical protein
MANIPGCGIMVRNNEDRCVSAQAPPSVLITMSGVIPQAAKAGNDEEAARTKIPSLAVRI